MQIKNILVATLIGFIFWVLLNNTLDPFILAIGAGLALILALLFCAQCNVFSELKLTPAAFGYTFLYLVVFLVELVKSNLDVARRVVTPSLPINPGIVEVKTQLKSRMGRMILANSITLTPGTLTIDIREDTLYIHWIDVQTEDKQGATEKIVRKFEKYLAKIYG